MDLDEADLESPENESVYNQTIYDERVLVQNWRFALEGVMIPCIGIPGIVGKYEFRPLIFIVVRKSLQHSDMCHKVN